MYMCTYKTYGSLLVKRAGISGSFEVGILFLKTDKFDGGKGFAPFHSVRVILVVFLLAPLRS